MTLTTPSVCPLNDLARVPTRETSMMNAILARRPARMPVPSVKIDAIRDPTVAPRRKRMSEMIRARNVTPQAEILIKWMSKCIQNVKNQK